MAEVALRGSGSATAPMSKCLVGLNVWLCDRSVLCTANVVDLGGRYSSIAMMTPSLSRMTVTERANVPFVFAHPLPRPQLGRVVVQGELGMLQHQQQPGPLGPRGRDAVVQRRVAGRRREEFVEGGRQPRGLGRRGLRPVGEQLPVIGPEAGAVGGE